MNMPHTLTPIFVLPGIGQGLGGQYLNDQQKSSVGNPPDDTLLRDTAKELEQLFDEFQAIANLAVRPRPFCNTAADPFGDAVLERLKCVPATERHTVSVEQARWQQQQTRKTADTKVHTSCSFRPAL